MICLRCKEEFGAKDTCHNCGIHKDRRILSRNKLRRRNIGGKRGRNSGKVGTSKNNK